MQPCKWERPWNIRKAMLMVLVLAVGAGAGGHDRSTGLDKTLLPLPACGVGYYQHDPIALSCVGGEGRKNLILTPAGTAERVLYWQAPAGTQDLEATAALKPAADKEDAAGITLTVQCADGEVLIDAHRGRLSGSSRSATIQGAEWSWSGDPQNANEHGFYVNGFKVNGTLHCDIEVMLSNSANTMLIGDIEYSWKGVQPCPKVVPGCSPCPQDVCHDDEFAFCDGSPYWECAPKSRFRQAMHHLGEMLGEAVEHSAEAEALKHSPPQCCQALVASCLACAESKTVAEFCADPVHAHTHGCEEATPTTSDAVATSIAVLRGTTTTSTVAPSAANSTTAASEAPLAKSAQTSMRPETRQPSSQPTHKPTHQPTHQPTHKPTTVPTPVPTRTPTVHAPVATPSPTATSTTVTSTTVSTMPKMVPPSTTTPVKRFVGAGAEQRARQAEGNPRDDDGFGGLPSWKATGSAIILSGVAIGSAFLVASTCMYIASRPMHYETNSWNRQGSRQFDRLPSNSMDDASAAAQGLLSGTRGFGQGSSGSRGSYEPLGGSSRSAAGVFA